MKICAYVQEAYSKQTYKNECLEARQFVGLKVVIDSLQRGGYNVDWAGKATVHDYDIVLVSLTAACDWYSFIRERVTWRKGNYKVIIGGAGVLHVVPFLPFGDYFVLGRGEKTVLELVRNIEKYGDFESENIINSKTFNYKKLYYIKQAENPYPHHLQINKNYVWRENMIGCNHKCFFCAYTWQRKCNFDGPFMWDCSPNNMSEKECAMIDYQDGSFQVNWRMLRTTAIDGFSERLRKMVNKPITHEILVKFLHDMVTSDAKPHQVKFFNVCGYPTETFDDWFEFIEALETTDDLSTINGKKWAIILHTTPFHPMPATPMACKPMKYINYRGLISKTLAPKLEGNIIFQGKNVWAVESMGTVSLPTIILETIASRGEEHDTENILKVCCSSRFWSASTEIKQKTLEKHFDVKKLFGAFTAENLPSRYLRTYLPIEKAWGK